MPQVAGHLVIAEKVKNTLNNPQYIENQLNAYRLGAIGPDLALFLFDPGAEFGSVINFALDVYSTIKEIKEIFDEIKQKALGPLEDMADWITGGLSTSIMDTIGISFEALKYCAATTLLPGTKIEVENPFAGLNYPGLPQGETMVVEANDLSKVLRMFGHPYTNDPPYKDPEPPGQYGKWWWVDLLHYRRTGSFAQSLLDNANSDLLRAYATGYFTHVAGDVCGHPYVNAVVGGPYRHHVIRHMVMENVIDTWLWAFYHNEDLINAGLNVQVDVGGDFSQIANYLSHIATGIYTDPNLPLIQPGYFPGGIPSPEDWQRAYDTFLLYLELATNSGLEPPKPPPGSPGEFFDEILESIEDSFEQLKNQFNPGNMSWWEWLLAPFLAAFYALALLTKLVTLPAEVLIRVSTLAPRWMLYYVQLALYEYVVNARWGLALSGWGKISQDDLQRPFAKLSYYIPPYRAGKPGTYKYPLKSVPRIPGFWLVDPASSMFQVQVEDPGPTEASPFAKYATPDMFIDGPGYYSPMNQALRQFAGPLDSPRNTISLEGDTAQSPQLGNAVDFAVKLINKSYPIASFDLDSDMGYGFLSWEGPPPDYKSDL